MTDWSTFAGLTGVVLVLLLALARLSQGAVNESANRSISKSSVSKEKSKSKPEPESSSHSAKDSRTQTDTEAQNKQNHEQDSGYTSTSTVTPDATRPRGDRNNVDESETEIDGDSDQSMPVPSSAQPQFSTVILLVNVALSHGLFMVILAASAWYTAVPTAALGLDFSDPSSIGLPALAIGIAVGLTLYAANAAGAAGASAFGYDYEEQLRELLTPETTIGWIVLLCLVLPVIALFEELLFRAALVGALSTGFDISPWFLAGGSSAAFAFGHGAQGRLGILVTGLLGFALAAVFIHTNSLLAVVVAHYLVNALEFVISGALGVEWN